MNLDVENPEERRWIFSINTVLFVLSIILVGFDTFNYYITGPEPVFVVLYILMLLGLALIIASLIPIRKTNRGVWVGIIGFVLALSMCIGSLIGAIARF